MIWALSTGLEVDFWRAVYRLVQHEKYGHEGTGFFHNRLEVMDTATCLGVGTPDSFRLPHLHCCNVCQCASSPAPPPALLLLPYSSTDHASLVSCDLVLHCSQVCLELCTTGKWRPGICTDFCHQFPHCCSDVCMPPLLSCPGCRKCLEEMICMPN